MKKISVIIPVYFNQHSLEKLFCELATLSKKLNSIDIELEIVFVDDGSGDNSFGELRRLQDLHVNLVVRIVKLTRNFGAWAAVKAGLSKVDSDAFSFLSADLQDSPDLIFQMASIWKAGNKFVICEREKREDPYFSRMNAAIYYFLVRKMVIPSFPSGGYDIALMDKSLLPFLIGAVKSSYIPVLLFSLGYKPKVIKYSRVKRVGGKSRWTFSKKLKIFLDVILGFSIYPVRTFSIVGSVVALLSFSYGALIVLNFLFYGNPVQGFPTIVSLVTFLLGLIILMLGIIGEYLLRIYDDNNKRPEYVIDEVF